MARIDLAGKTIAITGASSGIGRVTALACAAAGMSVVVAARRREMLDDLVREIQSTGGRAKPFVMDVSSRDQCRALLDFTLTSFGSLYSVFANAGYGVERSVLAMSDAELDGVFRTNFFGTLDLIKPAAEIMLRNTPDATGSRGHILICSSCVSKVGLPCYASYSASKAMQDHFGRAMRIELAPWGVHVSTVHPIGTRTEFFETSRQLSGGKKVSIQTPDHMKQPASVVADAIVRCLEKPKGEVWTSFSMRAALALVTLLPGLGDTIMARRMRGRLPDPLAAGTSVAADRT